jgi:hypothetical protein
MLKRIMLPYGYGKTCNQLLQIAHWIPAANEFEVPLYFPGFRRYAHLFSGTVNQRLPRFPRKAPGVGWPQAALSRLCSYAARVPHVNTIGLFFKVAGMLPGVVTFAWDDSGRARSMEPTKVIKDPRVAAGESLWVRGWLYRDQAGVAKHKPCIKGFFSPVPEIQQRVDACIRQNREGNTVLVGVHLRRGDYRTWAGGKYYYDDNVFRRLMQQMSKVLTDRKVRFLLVSNEPLDRSKYDGLDIAKGPSDPAGDLFSLAACDYIMGPPSTFTSWASLFGDVPLYTIHDPSAPLRLDGFTHSGA